MSVQPIIQGWVATEVARRLRATFGVYHWSEWLALCRECGVVVVRKPLPAFAPAFRAGRCIFVAWNLSMRDTALAVWHELAHIFMHPGGWQFWDGLPWGYLVLGKQERQADELALLLPDWSGF